ncbi:acetamidase/formamidase [Klebsormidium nitens]|uniref:Acetamidase/formamidase n=1 Tax=Klebsormidium nitens TaxID=105231 RepID=A0A1Y1IGP9_KLENI|nr:acetamidase/formamidase [Klebsormidium nitens]|eukprot:GAQ87318.1 acetamidase/formamidase [Klebsormidium nitens]
MKKEYPNPVQASRGQNALQPNHFHLAGKVVYFVFWQFFFGELVPTINCPKCGKVDRVNHDGWVGVTDKIRRVCSLDAPAFLYSKVFRCGKGKKKGEGCSGNDGKPYQFRSHDEGVLEQVRRQAPAVLEQLGIVFTRGGAIERCLLDTMVRNVASGASIADQQRMVREAHMRTFTQHKNTYIQYAAARARRRQAQGGSLLFPGVVQQAPPTPADFGEYGDKEGYRGWIPSTSWIAGVILADLTSRLAFLERHLAAVDGVFWRGDHTFQAASRIRSADGRKDYAAIYSVMNEWSQIVGQWAVGDTSFDDYATGLRDVLKRYDDRGFQLPKFMWVDNSRTVAAQLYNAIPSLSRVLEDATHVMRRVFEAIPDAHSLKPDFCRDYSSAMFKIHQPDKWALRKFLLDGGPGRRKWTQAEVAAKSGSYWRARCRHTIPPPQELVAEVEAVIKKYEGAICAINGDPLITDEVQRVHNLQLQLMREGALSDPLNVDEMYILVSAPGCMPRYVGVRGCSSLEGYHRHLNALLGGGNYSPELAGALIALFNYRWNYECAVRSKGAKDWGMYDHWLLEAMQDTCAAMGWPNPCPEWQRAPSTQERFGVHAAPPLVGTVLGTGASLGDEPEDEAGSLDEEAAFVESLLSEQELKSKLAAGSVLSSPPPPQDGQPALVRDAQQGDQSVPLPLPRQDGQPALMRAAQPGGLPAVERAAPNEGELPEESPPVAAAATQPGGLPSSSPPGQSGQAAAARPSPPGPSLIPPGQNGQPTAARPSPPEPFFVPPDQNGQPLDGRGALQQGGQPAPPSPPPINGQPPNVSATSQRGDQSAPPFVPPLNGRPPDVSAAPQPGVQPAPPFASPQTGSLPTTTQRRSRGHRPPIRLPPPQTSSLGTAYVPRHRGGASPPLLLPPTEMSSLSANMPRRSRRASLPCILSAQLAHSLEFTPPYCNREKSGLQLECSAERSLSRWINVHLLSPLVKSRTRAPYKTRQESAGVPGGMRNNGQSQFKRPPRPRGFAQQDPVGPPPATPTPHFRSKKRPDLYNIFSAQDVGLRVGLYPRPTAVARASHEGPMGRGGVWTPRPASETVSYSVSKDDLCMSLFSTETAFARPSPPPLFAAVAMAPRCSRAALLVLLVAAVLAPAAAVLDTLVYPSGSCSDPSTTYLQANSKTVRRGILNPTFPAVAHVQSGDTITAECVGVSVTSLLRRPRGKGGGGRGAEGGRGKMGKRDDGKGKE